MRYLLNIRLQPGDALVCAIQIFSHLDWLKMQERVGGGLGGVCMDQLGNLAVQARRLKTQ